MAEKKTFDSQHIEFQGGGSITSGGITEKKDVTSAIKINGADGRHFVDLTKDGTRKGWTTVNAPGAVQINAAADLKSGGSNPKTRQNGIFINAENGDIVIRAGRGKLRLEGVDVEIVATGSGKEGFFAVLAKNSIKMDANNITFNAKQALKLLTTGLLTLNGKMGMSMLAPLCNGASAATQSRQKKPGQIGRS